MLLARLQPPREERAVANPADYQEQESLREILASWRAEFPPSDDALRQATAELDEAGLLPNPDGEDRMVG